MASFNHAVPVESWTVGGLKKGSFVADVRGGWFADCEATFATKHVSIIHSIPF